MSETEKQLSIFEKIAKEHIPSAKIRENDEFMAILDLNPNCKWQSLVFPKTRYDSDVEKMPEDVYTRFLLAAKKVETILKKWLWVSRVGLIIEGLGVPHAHIKLYPMHWLSADWQWEETQEPIWFERYPGYLISQLGEQRSSEYLQQVAQEILENQQ